MGNDQKRGNQTSEHQADTGPGWLDGTDDPKLWGRGFNQGEKALHREQGQSGEKAEGDGVRDPGGSTRSDERIKEDVSDLLGNLGDVDPSEVEVAVSEGEVMLSGTVRERHWKHVLEDAAASVRGVRDVVNQIRVQR